jgi:hypothetical protein
LYGQLSSPPSLKLATLGDCVVQLPAKPLPPPVRAGSWVHGQLLTWIGHQEKNRAWELLIAAKEALDRSSRPDLALLHRLGACEGSDWFWWRAQPRAVGRGFRRAVSRSSLRCTASWASDRAEGNWRWRFNWAQLSADFGPALQARLAQHGRLP